MAKTKSVTERLPETAQAPESPMAQAIAEITPMDVKQAHVIDGAAKMDVARKGRKQAPENESKHDKLTRLANGRITKACKAIAQIGNLAAYRPTEAEVQKMMLALGESCASVQNRLSGIRRESITFSLR